MINRLLISLTFVNVVPTFFAFLQVLNYSSQLEIWSLDKSVHRYFTYQKGCTHRTGSFMFFVFVFVFYGHRYLFSETQINQLPMFAKAGKNKEFLHLLFLYSPIHLLLLALLKSNLHFIPHFIVCLHNCRVACIFLHSSQIDFINIQYYLPNLYI